MTWIPSKYYVLTACNLIQTASKYRRALFASSGQQRHPAALHQPPPSDGIQNVVTNRVGTEIPRKRLLPQTLAYILESCLAHTLRINHVKTSCFAPPVFQATPEHVLPEPQRKEVEKQLHRNQMEPPPHNQKTFKPRNSSILQLVCRNLWAASLMSHAVLGRHSKLSSF